MHWEYPAASVIILLILGLQQLFLYRRWRGIKQGLKGYRKKRFLFYISVGMTFFTVSTLYGGWFFVRYWESREKHEMKYIMEGVGPTFAYELERLGHAALTLDTPPDDPSYLNMINVMTDWMKINPLIQSIYTFRKNPQGEVVFILAPETDYDHNGVIEGENEERVPIGTIYKEVIPEIEAAFGGRYSVQDAPTSDKWSYCISVFLPLYGEGSAVPEAVLGIDFDGSDWNENLRLERFKAIGLVFGFLLLINAFYVLVSHYWLDMQKSRQQELDRELAHLDRLNLIGQIAASIGHEVRNPMTTVRGFLQLFQGKKEFRPYRDELALMIEELDRGNSIITEFLSLAKNKTVDFKPCSLNAVLRTILPILQSEALRMNHDLVMDLGNAPTFQMDTNEIRQLILNLYRNGLEAMTKQGKISIKTYTQNSQACLKITDEGGGIAPAVLENLGTPFLTTKENGTGLGLAVCFRIAEHHKAKIEVDTGQSGTTFMVKFPLK